MKRCLYHSTSLILLFFYAAFSLYAQKENYNWYFHNTGITFNTTPPSLVSLSKIPATEGCATISSTDGRLLFYTEGMNIWDSTHTLMPNGSGLKGHWSSTQSSIIMPVPGNAHLYYVFTTDQAATTADKGFHYSIVDMRLNNGKGDVVSSRKNIFIRKGLTERLTACQHANKIDYWVIVQKRKSDTVFVYRLNQNGLDTIPVVNKLDKVRFGYNVNFAGYMRVSPDGKKIGIAAFSQDTGRRGLKSSTSDTCVLADFDNQTGKISNVWKFPSGGDSYGLEFSAKSNFIYVTQGNPNFNLGVFQYNVLAPNYSSFINSRVKIDTTVGFLGALSLGPDGKIYLWNALNGIEVIHAPDVQGLASRFESKYIYKPYSSGIGLPNSISSFIHKKKIKVIRRCLLDTTQFFLVNNLSIDSFLWDFGDTLSGKLNQNRSNDSVFHVYHKAGVYSITLLSYYNTYVDTMRVLVEIEDHRPFLGVDTLICNSFNLKLQTQGVYQRYHWPILNCIDSAINIAQKGKYVLEVFDSTGCYGSDTINIYNPQVHAGILNLDTQQCLRSNLFSSYSRVSFVNDSIFALKWLYKDSLRSTDSVFKQSYTSAGIYKIKLVAISKNKCSDTTEVQLNVLPNPKSGIKVLNDSLCIENNPFVFTSNSNLLFYTWKFGDGDSSNLMSPSHTFSKQGRYNVRLKVIDSAACMTLDSTLIQNIKANVLATLNKDTQCLNQNKIFVQTSTRKKIYDWDLGDGQKETKQAFTHTYSKEGKYTILLHILDSFNCKADDTLQVVILKSPKAGFNFITNPCSRDVELINTSSNCKQSLWQIESEQFNSKDLNYTFNSPGIYKVKLIVGGMDSICRDTIEKQVDRSGDLKGELKIPNVFTPNEDAFNNEYKLGGVSEFCGDFSSIQIYNRWGLKVFEGDIVKEFWNGKLMNTGPELPSGNYYYILCLNYNSFNGKNSIINTSGVIQLIR